MQTGRNMATGLQRPSEHADGTGKQTTYLSVYESARRATPPQQAHNRLYYHVEIDLKLQAD